MQIRLPTPACGRIAQPTLLFMTSFGLSTLVACANTSTQNVRVPVSEAVEVEDKDQIHVVTRLVPDGKETDSPMARLTGTLVSLENCVGIEAHHKKSVYVLMFPHGSRLSRDSTGVELPDGEEVVFFKFDSTISVTGGETSMRFATKKSDTGECKGKYWWVVGTPALISGPPTD